MFTDFRQNVKSLAKAKGLTYAKIAAQAGIEECTIKCFMCGANDSRRVAEKIADVLGVKMTYSKGVYELINTNEEDRTMLRTEFTTRTGIHPDSTLYHVIERENERQNEDGHDVWPDKDTFCKAYKSNQNGLAERIQREADEELWRKKEAHRKAMAESSAQMQKLQAEIERLKKELDIEREWAPYDGAGTNLSQEKYEEMDANAADIDRLNDDDAAALLSEMFGFMPERITILHTVSTFERDRHGRLRVAQTFERDPLHISSDWSYIRFDCAGCQWELIDGELVPYED